MNFENIIGNPPYGKIGVDITNFILKQISYNDISILGTTAMLSKHNDVLALEYAYIRYYILNPVTKHTWVSQLILLGHKGKCDVIHTKFCRNPKEIVPNEVRLPFTVGHNGTADISMKCLISRNRDTSYIMSLSDEDYEYIKKHWDNMTYVERFWWLMDKEFYKKYVVQSDNQ